MDRRLRARLLVLEAIDPRHHPVPEPAPAPDGGPAGVDGVCPALGGQEELLPRDPARCDCLADLRLVPV